MDTQIFSAVPDTEHQPFETRRPVEVDYDVWYPFQWYVRDAERAGQLRFTCLKQKEDDGWNEGCNSLDEKPGEEDFVPDLLMMTSDHAGRGGVELEEYEKSQSQHSLLWFPESYRRPTEARQEEEWRDELSRDFDFFKDVATSRQAWRDVMEYWIFRELDRDWFTGDYFTFQR
ncbi:MAG: hypothetical protein FI717_00115 [SAR202 cluster bacterium]|nr:hypothetical protein [SAR202 cluster bacterium]